MKEKMPFLFILIAAFLWGTTGTAQTFTSETTHPSSLYGLLSAFVFFSSEYGREKPPLEQPLK